MPAKVPEIEAFFGHVVYLIRTQERLTECEYEGRFYEGNDQNLGNV
jgi:hypothetical protein